MAGDVVLPGPEPEINVQEAMPSYYDGKHAQADAHYFNRREFCFTFGNDIFARYQAFKDGTALQEAIQRRCPSKIDIGPVYSANPQDRQKFGASFQPLERELVFDIDLTDYDDVRTCGSGAHICSKCWPLMAVAVKIIDAGLRSEFGFQNILWVYSGRRGVHCWVCDPSARQLTDEQRSAVANWFAMYKGHEEGRAKIAFLGGVGAMHPAVERAARTLRAAWLETILPAQRLLEDGPKCETLLQYLPDEGLIEAVKKKWASRSVISRTSEDINLVRWQVLETEVNNKLAEERSRGGKGAGGGGGGGNYKVTGPLERCLNEIIMAHSYPRLDMEVSKKMNHLLKAPFCVHPKTGKVCVPLDPEEVDDFDPDKVPTVGSLLGELKAATEAAAAKLDAGGGEEGQTAATAAEGGSRLGKSEAWRHTAMARAVAVFERCLLNGLTAANREELAGKARMAMAVGQVLNPLDF
ncbi:hypothetical protein VOLCADRAFT_95007 [Volvox carteri f. nagariensis]|uniref:DNA primase n=1 Tax=Volvox carteri f. nagariensis TaxID=3068 RepID=D8U6C8_VOLCA|nr:uncharacterized protein VOLCADRAFT_95007 [Volvox carteri f. nagariensis]EFJ44694.1 hypothetical protein VOLCADRAFT_95007 [Volvox carteri f. nagariensis]|eukprot:XP_002954270.1 hypothetical protein VOLCADRAFT_95007 [Volvox carteri f. nagariensis]